MYRAEIDVIYHGESGTRGSAKNLARHNLSHPGVWVSTPVPFLNSLNSFVKWLDVNGGNWHAKGISLAFFGTTLYVSSDT